MDLSPEAQKYLVTPQEVLESFPIHNPDRRTYPIRDAAMELVGQRHDKGDLADLVAALIHQRVKLQDKIEIQQTMLQTYINEELMPPVGDDKIPEIKLTLETMMDELLSENAQCEWPVGEPVYTLGLDEMIEFMRRIWALRNILST